MTSIALNGALQLIESFIIFYFFESVSFLSKGKLKRYGIVFIAYLIMFVANIISNYNTLINATGLFVFFILCQILVYKLKHITAIFYTVLLMCMIAISEFTAMSLLSAFMNNNIATLTENPIEYTLVILVSKSLLLFLVIFVGSIIGKVKADIKTDFVFYIYPISLIVVIVIYNILAVQYDFSNKSKLLLSISSFVLTISIILISLYQQSATQKDKELEELKSINQKVELDNKYFEILEHQNEELQIFVHDTKKHYRNLFEIADDSNRIKDYIKNVVDDIDEANKIGKTSNKLLDLVIDKYNFICEKNSIEFEKNIHNSIFDFIDDNDFTSIFNNLLDNAIESAIISTQKHITLGINRIGKMMIIEVINSCDKAPKIVGNNIISSKNDTISHGYGLKSIYRSVKKYKGDVEWDYNDDNKEFTTSIIFTLQ